MDTLASWHAPLNVLLDLELFNIILYVDETKVPSHIAAEV